MARVKVYTTDYCPYCVQAKRLLREMAIDYEEIDVGADTALRMELVERAGGRRTVPQIFIDDESIGGYTELRALADAGSLGHLTS